MITWVVPSDRAVPGFPAVPSFRLESLAVPAYLPGPAANPNLPPGLSTVPTCLFRSAADPLLVSR